MASSLYATGTNLSRSVSSAGEHQSDTYVSPILPKRAETFGGFDNQAVKKLQMTDRGVPASGAGTPEFKPGDSRLFVSIILIYMCLSNVEELGIKCL